MGLKNPDGTGLISGNLEGLLLWYDLNTQQNIRELAGCYGAISGVAFSPTGDVVAACSMAGTVKLWKPYLDNPVTSLATGLFWATSLEFSPNGDALVVGSRERSLHLFEATSWESIQRRDPVRGTTTVQK